MSVNLIKSDYCEACESLNCRCDDTLGPCGCVDYHYADCPTRGGYEEYGRYELDYDDPRDMDLYDGD